MTTNTDVAMPELLPCPFCSRPVPDDLSDTLYPSGIYWREDPDIGRHYISHSDEMARAEDDNKCWEMNCTQNMGGCGASIHADSREEVIAAWNRRAAIQQAAGCEHLRGDVGSRWCALAEQPEYPAQFPQRILDLIKEVARREDSGIYGPWEDENGEPMQDDADAALAWIAKQQPVHLGGGEGGGVPLSDERLIVSFLRNTTVFHQSDTPEWLYARDGDGNSASIRASEIVSAIRNIIKELP